MNNMYIYPDFLLNEIRKERKDSKYDMMGNALDYDKHIEIFTQLRVRYIDSYYLVCFKQTAINVSVGLILIKLIKEIYNFQLLGIIDLNTKDVFGNEVFRLDDNQESEEDRIKKFML